MDKQMEGGGLSFKFVSSLNIRCDKVNAPKSKSRTKSPNWLRYKSALTQHYKKIKNHPEWVSKAKPFLNLLDW